MDEGHTQWETYPICTGKRLTIDPQGAERRVRGQALVPLTGPLFRDGTHEVPLQLTDASMMLEHILVRLVEILRGGKSRGEKNGVERREDAGGGWQEISQDHVDQKNNKRRKSKKWRW